MRVFIVFSKHAGDDAVFPAKNVSPKILTKSIEQPYSYELLPEYEREEKKLSSTKAINGKGRLIPLTSYEVSLKELRKWRDAHILGV